MNSCPGSDKHSLCIFRKSHLHSLSFRKNVCIQRTGTCMHIRLPSVDIIRTISAKLYRMLNYCGNQVLNIKLLL